MCSVVGDGSVGPSGVLRWGIVKRREKASGGECVDGKVLGDVCAWKQGSQGFAPDSNRVGR